MKKLLLAIFLNIPFLLQAQLKHFIYFQTEGKQPFYAKLDRKLFSSSAAGYLIIPKLQDGSYTISIGFPKGDKAEQQFTCKVENNDAGYLLKNFGDRGWGLFNLQTLEVAMAGAPSKEGGTSSVVKNDAFSSMLSDAVNDPAIRKAEKPVEAAQTAQKKTVSPPDPQAPVLGQEIPQPAGSIPVITKKLVNYGLDGLEMMYIDGTPGNEDTVRILIPNENAVAKITRQSDQDIDVWEQGASSTGKKATGTGEPRQELKKSNVLDSAAYNTLPAPSKEETKTSGSNLNEAPGSQKDLQPNETTKKPAETKFLSVEMEPSSSTKDDSSASVANANQEVANRPPMINSDCKDLASEEDFLKLRKKMAGEGDEEKMLAIARKAFKTRCFSTDQVKNLAVLFLNDASKYRFFDLAFQFVSDSHNYSNLQSLLSDPYYVARFKVMVNR